MTKQEPQFAKKDVAPLAKKALDSMSSDEDKSEESLAKRAMDALESGKISEEDQKLARVALEKLGGAAKAGFIAQNSKLVVSSVSELTDKALYDLDDDQYMPKERMKDESVQALARHALRTVEM